MKKKNIILAISIFFGINYQAFAEDVPDNLPDHVTATVEKRNKELNSLQQNGQLITGSFFVEDLLKWLPGRTIRVAFLGGNTALHKEIADATKEITDVANIKLDFGLTNGQYRSWSTTDTEYQAEIRISFDHQGYFSLIGRDSINPEIGAPNETVGGRPNQRSMNFGGYDRGLRPDSWKRTVRHEFLHALAFLHEHQQPLGCDSEFRWEDDPGYQATVDSRGQYIPDLNGKRPGIYTYLSGYPNNWNKGRVDHNLRQDEPHDRNSHGEFDRESIMLYRFDNLFYVSLPNRCAPLGNSESLSNGDKEGLKKLYPEDEQLIAEVEKRNTNILNAIKNAKSKLSTSTENLLQSVLEDVQDISIRIEGSIPEK